MVKSSGGRSKGKGSGGGGGGSGSAAPSRRLKKGGKRGRRLCHRDGCTLCPSFGFDGEVAVSCSHHKEDGTFVLSVKKKKCFYALFSKRSSSVKEKKNVFMPFFSKRSLSVKIKINIFMPFFHQREGRPGQARPGQARPAARSRPKPAAGTRAYRSLR